MALATLAVILIVALATLQAAYINFVTKRRGAACTGTTAPNGRPRPAARAVWIQTPELHDAAGFCNTATVTQCVYRAKSLQRLEL